MRTEIEIGNIIRKLRGDMSLRDFAKKCDVSHTTIDNIEKGVDFRTGKPVQIKITTLQKIANACNVPVSYIIGDPSHQFSAESDLRDRTMATIEKTPDGISNANIIDGERSIYMIPVFESVSAGFGAYADNYITEYMPMYFSSPSEANESIFVTVKGDSMYPKIENGDIVLVHKQDSIDGGNIAVILVDGEEALVKKIVYGDNCIELHSVNPMYQTMYFRGADMSRIRVLGMVKKIIKSV